jgi:hypothetical protein
MTPEDVRKAVSEAAEVVLAPLDERIGALEATVAQAQAEEDPVTEEGLMSNEAAEALDAEAIRKMVSEAASAAVTPLAERLQVLESAAGMRRSGLEEQGAHTVRKADGSFSWEGSGLLL